MKIGQVRRMFMSLSLVLLYLVTVMVFIVIRGIIFFLVPLLRKGMPARTRSVLQVNAIKPVPTQGGIKDQLQLIDF
jgi:hypothetical protein